MQTVFIKFICSITLLLSVLLVSAQNNGKLATGINLQVSANPVAEFISWSNETQQLTSSLKNKIWIGPTFQFNAYESFKIETSLYFNRSIFRSDLTPNSQISSISINQIRNPWGFSASIPSPIPTQSEFRYHFGLFTTYSFVSEDEQVNSTRQFFDGGLYLGFKVSTKNYAIGRFEYGITAYKNITLNNSFYVRPPFEQSTKIIHNQDAVQINISINYFFSPRIKTWKQSRYSMDAIM